MVRKYVFTPDPEYCYNEGISYNVEVVYTPMINAGMYISGNKKYRLESFNIPQGEEGGPLDRPLIVQVNT